MAYYEEICKDYIWSYPSSGYDTADEMSRAMHILPYLFGYTPELYSRVASSITG